MKKFDKARFEIDLKSFFEQHEMVNEAPAKEWIDGLALGNGDIGAMVYGEPQRLKFSLNKSDVWDNRAATDEHPDYNHKNVVTAIEQQDWERLGEITSPTDSRYRHSYPSFQPCGQLEIETELKGKARNFRQSLSLFEAAVRTEYESEGRLNVLSFVAATQNVLVVNLSSDGATMPATILHLFRFPNEEFPSPTYGMDEKHLWLDFTFPDGLRYVMLARVEGAEFTGEVNSEGVVARIQSGEARELTAFLTIVTSKESDNPWWAAKEALEQASADGREAVFGEHKLWWEEFWRKSFIDLPDDLIENLWYFEIYKMACCSREEKQAPGLQGLWSIDNVPPWHGDYHLDLNIQMTYWPIYASNHVELGEPFYRLFYEMLPRVKEDTLKYYGWEGAKYPGATYLEGGDIGGWFTAASWPATSAWIAQHYWWHYLYTKDSGFLRQIAYPVMKECARFYQGYLRKDESGKYYIFPSVSPEQGDNTPAAWGRNPAIDIALIKMLFEAIIQASRALGADEKERADWAEILSHLPQYPIEEGHLIDMEGRNFTNSHRHMSFLTPIYPAGDIGLGSSEEWQRIGRASLQNALDRGYSEYFGFSFPWLACVAARLGLGDIAVEMLHEYLDVYANVNGFSMSFDFKYTGKGLAPGKKVLQIEAGSAFAAAVNEMLLQSHEGKIRVFPAVPSDWDVKFATLRAVGGFLVSSEREGRAVKYILIKSLAGETCRIVNPWSGGEVRVRDLDCGDILLETIATELQFSTEKGHIYAIETLRKPLESFPIVAITGKRPERPRFGIKAPLS